MKEKKATSTRSCEIVSKLKDDDGNILFNLEHMKKVLEERECIKEYCYIIHDKDTYTEDDEKKNSLHKVGELKPVHIHLLLRFTSPQHYPNVGKWFEVEENFVEKIKGKWEDAVSYQIHRNTPEKYQYSIDEVTANFDVQSVIDKANQKNYIQKILQQILDGTIREYNKTCLIPQILLIYHAREIEQAFKVRAEHLASIYKERNLEVIFITGASGLGKTTLAKQIAKENRLDYYVSSGSNDIMDGYRMEPCLIIDDIRPSVLGLSDLLKLLDNNTASTVKSRYKNKFLNCELIILTTVLDIDTFYKNVFSDGDEPVTQLKRRCGTYIKVYKDEILVSVWDNKDMKYVNPVAYKNNILKQFEPKNKTKEDIRNHVQELMPFLELEDNEVIMEEPFCMEKLHTEIEPISDEKFYELLPRNND